MSTAPPPAGPNRFAAVMGLGIVASAATTLPWGGEWLGGAWLAGAARTVWVVAALWLVVLVGAALRHPRRVRTHLDDPVMGHFYGAPAMALISVGNGALLLGAPLLGERGAVVLGAGLWTTGTALGLVTAVALPVRLFARADVDPAEAAGAWLVPVVPPMVSAATGPTLAVRLDPGLDSPLSANLLLACGLMFGAALLAALLMISMIWSRLVHHGVGASAAVPTLWIVLGPLGQGATAAHGIAEAVAGAAPSSAGAARAAGLALGLPLMGFALLWLAIALALTVRAARDGLPFSPAWWSFTFPLGTCVTGLSGIAATSGLALPAVGATVLYAGLVCVCGVTAARTLRPTVQQVARAALAALRAVRGAGGRSRELLAGPVPARPGPRSDGC